MVRLLTLFFLIFLSISAASSTVVRVVIKGAIGPASSEYLQEGVEFAKEKNAHMILIELDTPGGLSTSMREMIQSITNSPIPTTGYIF